MATDKNTAQHKVWGGTLSFGLVSIPCALYAAAREEKISFNQLHAKCLGRLKQQPMTCPSCSVAVTKEEIVKGYELPDGKFVTVSKADIESAEPESSRTLEITDFVPVDSVDPVYFESSFFLDVAEAGAKAYSLVWQAMQMKGMVALAKLCYFGKEHVAAIRATDNGLMLHTLFWDYEVRRYQYAELPQVSDQELTVACQLIDALASGFEPARYEDNYRKNILALIEQKQCGTAAPVVPIAPKKAPVVDIAAALAASIANARQQKARVSA